MVREANADSDAINDYVHNRQHKAQEFFDKVNQDSKRAQSVLSSGGGGRNHVGMSSSGPPQ
jgi:hypothetical protein